MDALLAAPAAVIIVVAVFQIRRARAERRTDDVLDLRTPPTPRVDLDYLLAERPQERREVTTPVLEGRNLGARMLAAHQQTPKVEPPRPPGVIRLRRRGEPLVAPR